MRGKDNGYQKKKLYKEYKVVQCAARSGPAHTDFPWGHK